MLGRGLAGFGLLDVLDQALLGFGLGEDDDPLAFALGLFGGAQALDALFLLGDGLLDGDAFADDVGDVALLRFEFLLGRDAGQLFLAFAADDFEDAVLLDALGLDGDDAFAVLLGDGDLAEAVLVLDAGGLFGPDPGGLALEALFGLDLLDFGVLAGAEGLDLALLADLGLGLAALEFEHGLAGLDVLALDLLLLGAAVLVRGDRFDRGELGDLADALRVEDVLGVELVHRGLLEVVDRGVFEGVAVEVGADHVEDAVAELVAVGVQVGEVELLADGLERLGELGVEQLLERVLVGGALGADRAGDVEDVFDGGVDPHEERDGDVGADVVLADQAVFARAVDLDGLDRDVHVFGAVDDRQHEGRGEGDLAGAQFGDDQGLAGRDLPVEADDHEQQAEEDEACDHERDQRRRIGGVHAVVPNGTSRERGLAGGAASPPGGGGAAEAGVTTP